MEDNIVPVASGGDYSDSGSDTPVDKAGFVAYPKKLPLIMRKPAQRFGSLSYRMGPKLYFLCMFSFLLGAFGIAMLIIQLFEIDVPMRNKVDFGASLILTVIGVFAQYRLGLHRAAIEKVDEFPDHPHVEDEKGRTILLPKSHRKMHEMMRPLENMRKEMPDRLKALRGSAADHLRHRPPSDYLTKVEVFTCFLFTVAGGYGTYYMVAAFGDTSIPVDLMHMAGSITFAAVGFLMALRLLYYISLVLRQLFSPRSEDVVAEYNPLARHDSSVSQESLSMMADAPEAFGLVENNSPVEENNND